MNDLYFVCVNSRTISDYKYRANHGYSRFNEFSVNEITTCHTTMIDAIRKCNNNGYIFVYDSHGNFVESIFLLSPNAFQLILKYIDCDEHSRRKYAMEWALSDQQSFKGFFRSRYNVKNKVDEFVVMVDVKTETTHLEFFKPKCVITR